MRTGGTGARARRSRHLIAGALAFVPGILGCSGERRSGDAADEAARPAGSDGTASDGTAMELDVPAGFELDTGTVYWRLESIADTSSGAVVVEGFEPGA